MSRSLLRPLFRAFSGAFAGAACLATLLAVPGVAHAQAFYQQPQIVSSGQTPLGVAAADFARSGLQSLAVTENASNTVEVFLASGPAAFGAYTSYGTCAGPSAIVAADLNNDGYPDILVACPTNNTVDLLLNDGTGHFGAATAYAATDPVALVVGDFANNGQLGVAALNGTGGVTILMNLTGNLVTHAIAFSGDLTGIVTGDFNHDGNLDLAVSDRNSSDNDVHILLGDGTGNFTVAGTYSAGKYPTGLVAADFNHDGNLDLAVSDSTGDVVTMLLGNGDGTFTTQPNPQSAGLNPTAISVTDVNSDGNPDVIVYNTQNPQDTAESAYTVLLGNGDGTLQAPQTVLLSSAPGLVPAVADFNRDGKPDLAFTQLTANRVNILLNNTLPTQYPGGRSFSSAQPISAGNGNMADSITTGDFNQDGNLDVAVSYLEDNVVKVLQGGGNGTFTLSGTYAVGQQPYYVTSGDLNGDGYPDLVAVNSAVNSPNGTISVLMNKGKAGGGTFASAVTYNVGRLPYQAAIGDLNGDGYPDIAVTNYGANTVSILYGSKNGTFTAGPTLATGPNPYGVAIGDFAHDGYPDIAVTCFGTQMLYIFPNAKNGTFGSPYMYSTGSGPMTLVTGDFNRDGKLDIVVANATGGPAGDNNPLTSGNNISFFAGNGDGTFKAGVIGPSLNFPQSIAAGDVNGDGILDIVGVAPNYNAVAVTLGAGDGTFGSFDQRSQGEFTAPKQPWAIALGDFHNDGKLDIVTADTYNPVNITIPAYQSRYMTEYPAVAGGVPSVDLLSNTSGTKNVVTLDPNGNNVPATTPITFAAQLSPALGGVTPTGAETFEDSNGSPISNSPVPLNGGGAASVTLRNLGSGTHIISGLYSGDVNYQPNTTVASGQQVIIVAGTPVTLSFSPSTIPYQGNFQVTITVTGNVANRPPTGTVSLYIYTPQGFEAFTDPADFGFTSCTGDVCKTVFQLYDPDGVLTPGSYIFYAQYNQGGNYPGGTSANEILTVTAAAADISLDCELARGGAGEVCFSQVTNPNNTYGTSQVVQSGTVDFSLSGGGAVAQAIEDQTINYSGGRTVTGYYAVQTYAKINGFFTETATFPAQGDFSSATASGSFCSSGCGGAGPTDRTNAFSSAARGVPPMNLSRTNNLNLGSAAVPSRRKQPIQKAVIVRKRGVKGPGPIIGGGPSPIIGGGPSPIIGGRLGSGGLKK